MPAKQLLFQDAARDKIRRGVDALAEAVKVTLGPRGRTVILEREFGPPQIVNSGVLVAKSIELEDRFENMGAQLLREVAARTSEMAGDGTSTATVLAHGMIHEGPRYLAGGMNPIDLKRGIETAIEAVVVELKRLSKPCTTSQDIAHLAVISANNDRSIGALLASAIDQVGREGAIAIEDSSGLVSVLEKIVKAERPLLVVAEEVDSDSLAALVINTMRGTLKTCAVKASGFGDRRKAMVQEIAVLTGGQVVNTEVGLTLAKVTLADLGRANRVEVTKDNTTVGLATGAPLY